MTPSRVFVVDRSACFGGAWPQGFLPIAPDAAEDFLGAAARAGRFEPRPLAEATPAWKQWIPYCVLTCGAGDDRGVFVVQRTKGQSEQRLHGAWSIGLGGHVEPEDGSPDAAAGSAFFAAALERELLEELDLRVPAPLAPRFLGVLNDDSTEVGRVHAGLVYQLHLDLPVAAARGRVAVREICKMTGDFTHLVGFFKLWQTPTQFETWSQVLVRAGILVPNDGFRTVGSGALGG